MLQNIFSLCPFIISYTHFGKSNSDQTTQKWEFCSELYENNN